MNQAEPEDQTVPWAERKCSQNPSALSHDSLPVAEAYPDHNTL